MADRIAVRRDDRAELLRFRFERETPSKGAKNRVGG